MTTWKDVISSERFALNNHPDFPDLPDPTDNPEEPTSDLVNDVNQVVTSSAFRRLQGKAQVYIAPENDFVRTRLTHTLEVVGISRLLTGTVFSNMDDDSPNHHPKWRNQGFIDALRNPAEGRRFRKRELVESIAAACHLHDIGNPPFGHIGEYAIASWFREAFRRADHDHYPGLHQLNAGTAKFDFASFDGNPQGFRTVTRLLGWKELGGLQLTYTTLASSIKYTWASQNAPSSTPNKFGFFNSEHPYFTKIFEELRLFDDVPGSRKYRRHPFSFLLEAADDIAYCTSDIEDGFKMGLIDYVDAEQAFKAISSERFSVENVRWNWLDKHGLQSDRIKYLRAISILALVHAVAQKFGTNADAYLNGSYSEPLLDTCSLANQALQAKNLVKNKVHLSKEKAANEQGAYNIIHSLLSSHSSAIESLLKNRGNSERLGENVQNLLVNCYRIYDAADLKSFSGQAANMREAKLKQLMQAPAETLYRNLVDYIAGMTDKQAIDMARKMRGETISTK